MGALITRIVDGPRHAVVHAYITPDPEGLELVQALLLDPMVDLTERTPSLRLVIEEVWYSFSKFDARLEFGTGDASENPAWVLTAPNGYMDFRPFGGLKDFSGLDGTGKVLLTTMGFADGVGGNGSEHGSMVLKLRKTNLNMA